MKLPNRETAQIRREKITGYLLSTTHRDGRHKAKFFIGYGFLRQRWEELASALRRHAAENNVVRVDKTAFGQRYVVEGRLLTPDGRAPNVRVVWFVAEGETTPRLVTAYPAPPEKVSG